MATKEDKNTTAPKAADVLEPVKFNKYINQADIPPRFESEDEFINYIAGAQKEGRKIPKWWSDFGSFVENAVTDKNKKTMQEAENKNKPAKPTLFDKDSIREVAEREDKLYQKAMEREEYTKSIDPNYKGE